MDVERSLGEALRLGVLDRWRKSARAISNELRGKTGDRGREPELGNVGCGDEVMFGTGAGTGTGAGPDTDRSDPSSPATPDGFCCCWR